MARIGISQQQVAEMADSLVNEGITVTVQTLRERLGSGSFTTLSKHLTTWKEKQDKSNKVEVPEPPANIEQTFRQVWGVA